MEAMLGCPVEISGESIWGRERDADWDELDDLKLDDDNSWLQKYLEFLAALVETAGGEYPVSQPILRGVTDLLGALRGNSQALIDTMETPDIVKKVAGVCADAIIKVTQKQYDIIQPFHGGFLIEQFGMWAPDKLVRLQEDVSAVYSPDAYCGLIQEYDRAIAGVFPYCLIQGTAGIGETPLNKSSLTLDDRR